MQREKIGMVAPHRIVSESTDDTCFPLDGTIPGVRPGKTTVRMGETFDAVCNVVKEKGVS